MLVRSAKAWVGGFGGEDRGQVQQGKKVVGRIFLVKLPSN
jgi:hypothetical protein